MNMQQKKGSSKGIFGVSDMQIHYGLDEPVRINVELVAEPGYNPHHLLGEEWSDIFPGNVIVKCEYCGQWGARKAECKHCGHPID